MPEQLQEPLLPGFKPVMELLHDEPQRIIRIFHKKNLRINELKTLQDLSRKHGIPLVAQTEAALDELCAKNSHGNISHQGLIAVLSQALIIPLEKLFAETPKSPLPLIIALDQIQDTGNLGAISRTAWALGCAGLLLPEHNSAAPGAAAFRASAGALAKLPLAVAGNLARALDTAEEKGFNIYGAAKKPQNDNSALFANAFRFQWQLPAILCMGNETKGLRPGVAKRCSQFLSIPFAREFDSLNIAQATAILAGLCAAQFANA